MAALGYEYALGYVKNTKKETKYVSVETRSKLKDSDLKEVSKCRVDSVQLITVFQKSTQIF